MRKTLHEEWYGMPNVQPSARGVVIDADFKANEEPPQHVYEVPQFADYTPTEKVALASRMQAVVVALRGALAAARTRVNMTPSASAGLAAVAVLPFLAPLVAKYSASSEVKQNVLNGLMGIERGIDKLAGEQYDNVLAGKLDPDRWYNIAKVWKDGIASMLQELNESSNAALLGQSFTDVQGDIAAFSRKFQSFAKDVGDTASTLKWPILIGGLAIGGFVLYQYLTAPLRLVPKMNGYNKKRRVKRVKLKVLR